MELTEIVLTYTRAAHAAESVKERRCKCGNERATWSFVVDLEPPGMRRRQVKRGGFTTKGAAQEMSRLQQERADGRYVAPTKLTLNSHLDMWLEGLVAREEVRANTRDEWGGQVRTHLKPRLGSVNGHTRTRAGLSPKSVWNVHRCLHRALADAVKDGLIRSNPATGATNLPREKQPSSSGRRRS